MEFKLIFVFVAMILVGLLAGLFLQPQFLASLSVICVLVAILWFYTAEELEVLGALVFAFFALVSNFIMWAVYIYN